MLSIAPQLKPEEALALADRTLEAMKGTTDRDQLRALEQVLESIASHSKPEEVQALANLVLEAMQEDSSVDIVKALTALAQQVPWPEHLNLFVTALKYPTVYDGSRDVLIEAIKAQPEARTIKPAGDLWAVVEWLKAQPGIDLTTPPRRTKAAIR